MRKPVHAICKQQRRRAACASSSFNNRNCRPLPSFYGCAGRFALVANPEDRFSHDEAHFINKSYCNDPKSGTNRPRKTLSTLISLIRICTFYHSVNIFWMQFTFLYGKLSSNLSIPVNLMKISWGRKCENDHFQQTFKQSRLHAKSNDRNVWKFYMI